MFRLLLGQNFEVKSTDADAARAFIAVFRRTWSRIPLRARRAILQLWRDHDIPAAFWKVFVRPDVAGPWIVELREQLDNPKMAGGCCPPDCHLQFSLVWFRAVPEEVAGNVIAHEFAHAYVWATGKGEEFADQEAFDYSTNPDSYLNDPEEVEVRRLTTDWGFDETAFFRWSKRLGWQVRKKMIPKGTGGVMAPFGSIVLGRAIDV